MQTLFSEKEKAVEVVDQEPENTAIVQAAPMAVSNPLSIIERAIEKGIDADTMAKLVDLQERIQRNQAEAAFNQAMLDFQGECPVVIHDKEGSKGMYTYATLPRIISTVKPIMKKFGLTMSFDSLTTELNMTIRCTISHVAGHSRTNSVDMGISGTNAMSKPQMAASALTYGRRHALCAALGIVCADTDDDARDVHDREPAKNPSARPEPQVQPRNKRDLSARLAEVARRWKMASEAEDLPVTDEAFREWVERTTGISGESARKSEAWSEGKVALAEEAVLTISSIPF